MEKRNIQTSALLMEHCLDTISRFDASYIQTGEKYNIFKIAGISEKEVIMCRIIANLLNPKGSHYKGDIYLIYFIEEINNKLKIPITIDTKNTNVYTEYSTDIQRRIDIVIEDRKTFIPIEVKINAYDQENQISHYAEYSQIKNCINKVPVIYLTIDGKDPDDDKIKKSDYISISFKNEILNWLKKCLKNNETEKTKPISEILKQLINSIKSIYGISEDKKMEEAILSLVTQSEDTIKSSLAIKQAIESLDGLCYELFKNKVLVQLKKYYANASWIEDGGWYHINIPIKNNNYHLAINYDWCSIGIWTDEKNKNNNTNEITNLCKKMNELTGVNGEVWGDGCIWGSEENSCPLFSNSDDSLYYFYLYKQYNENTTEIVNNIVKMVIELDNI